jgi:hypothetical protein
MSHRQAGQLEGPIHRENISDTICPSYSASFQNVFDLESNWITSNLR